LSPGIGKRLASFGFTLRKAYERISTIKPSILIVASIITAFSLFLLAGGVYDILEQPLAAIPYGSTILFYYPYTLAAQAVIESIGVMIAYALGSIGLLLMYQSTKFAYKPRQAFMLLVSGIALILIAYIYVESLVYQKLNPPQQQSSSSA
jgi:hypothetical protein